MNNQYFVICIPELSEIDCILSEFTKALLDPTLFIAEKNLSFN